MASCARYGDEDIVYIYGNQFNTCFAFVPFTIFINISKSATDRDHVYIQP